MKTGFIYEWTDNSTRLKYIGKHEGTVDDGYVGSGTIFIKEYNLRPGDFTREILWISETTTSTEVCLQEERYLQLITDDELYYGKNRKYYNQVRNSTGYTSENNPMNNREVVARMKETQKRLGIKDQWQNRVAKYGYEEACRMNGRGKEGNKYATVNKGKPKTEEHKQKIAATIKENYRLGLVKTTNKGGKPAGRKRKMPYEDLVNMVAEHGIPKTAELLEESYEAVRSRYYTAKKRLTNNTQ